MNTYVKGNKPRKLPILGIIAFVLAITSIVVLLFNPYIAIAPA
jgi:hypothetical protein